MSLYNDYVVFVDSGAKVPYFMDGVRYYRKPCFFSDFFEYDFKQFYYSKVSGCFVGIASSSFVRKISKQEFDMMKELFSKKEKELKNIKERVQLTLF